MLPAGRCMPPAALWRGAWWLLAVGRCLLAAASWPPPLLVAVCGLPPAGQWLVPTGCGLVAATWWLVADGCRLPPLVWWVVWRGACRSGVWWGGVRGAVVLMLVLVLVLVQALVMVDVVPLLVVVIVVLLPVLVLVLAVVLAPVDVLVLANVGRHRATLLSQRWHLLVLSTDCHPPSRASDATTCTHSPYPLADSPPPNWVHGGTQQAAPSIRASLCAFQLSSATFRARRRDS